jgi:hypothetical protein
MARERVRLPRSPRRLPWRLNASPLRKPPLACSEGLHPTFTVTGAASLGAPSMGLRRAYPDSYSTVSWLRARGARVRARTRSTMRMGARRRRRAWPRLARRARRGTRMRPTRPVRALVGRPIRALHASPPLRRRPRPRRARRGRRTRRRSRCRRRPTRSCAHRARAHPRARISRARRARRARARPACGAARRRGGGACRVCAAYESGCSPVSSGRSVGLPEFKSASFSLVLTCIIKFVQVTLGDTPLSPSPPYLGARPVRRSTSATCRTCS